MIGLSQALTNSSHLGKHAQAHEGRCNRPRPQFGDETRPLGLLPSSVMTGFASSSHAACIAPESRIRGLPAWRSRASRLQR